MIYRVVRRVRFIVQILVLQISYRFRRSPVARSGWVVGPYEIAGMVHQLASALPGGRSVILARHPFYSFEYDWQPSTRRYPFAGRLRYWLLGPWKLGELARQATGILYVSAEGFINAELDQREYEFAFLAAHGVTVGCFFTGNDIRSPALMKQMEQETGRPNLGTYLAEVNRVFGTAGYEELKRRIAASANRHASVVFNADVDQRSYLDGPSEPFLYFQPDSLIANDLSRFDGPYRPLVVHAPSSPIIKGTPLVRAAVDELKADGYDFDYLELSGVPHAQVLEALSRAHIALNEFYSYVPGVFGVEAMAAGCALITSADEGLDPQLPSGSNRAWVPTPHFRIAQHLRELLDDPARTRAQAAAGRDWVRANATASVSGARLTAALQGRTSAS